MNCRLSPIKYSIIKTQQLHFIEYKFQAQWLDKRYYLDIRSDDSLYTDEELTDVSDKCVHELYKIIRYGIKTELVPTYNPYIPYKFDRMADITIKFLNSSPKIDMSLALELNKEYEINITINPLQVEIAYFLENNPKWVGDNYTEFDREMFEVFNFDIMKNEFPEYFI